MTSTLPTSPAASSFRLVKPLPDAQNRVTHGGAIEPRPTFISVAPTSLMVDETYQRSLSGRSERMIRDIVRAWDWARFKPPLVVETGKGLVIVDGQHTAIAAATRGIAFIPVLVVDADGVEAQAKAFIGHNTMRVSVTKTQVFKAALAAGDEDATTAKQVCDRAKVKIMIYPPGRPFAARETMAVNAIVQMAKRRGALVARQILEAIADGGVAPIKVMHIRAAESLMRDKGYAHDRLTYADLTATVAKCRHDEDIQVKTLAAAMKVPAYQALATHWSKFRSRRNQSLPPLRGDDQPVKPKLEDGWIG